MIPYQIDGRTYFIPEKWFWDNQDLPMNAFIQAVINREFIRPDIEESLSVTFKDKKIKLKVPNLKTDNIDRKWLTDDPNYFE